MPGQGCLAFFTCENCGALYQVVRGSGARQDPTPQWRDSVPLLRWAHARSTGQSVLKYFHLREAARRSLRETSRANRPATVALV
jgi:hypothetical protein